MKQKIETELKLGEASSQKLIFSGKILKDKDTIKQLKLKETDFFVVMVSKVSV